MFLELNIFRMSFLYMVNLFFILCVYSLGLSKLHASPLATANWMVYQNRGLGIILPKGNLA